MEMVLSFSFNSPSIARHSNVTRATKARETVECPLEAPAPDDITIERGVMGK